MLKQNRISLMALALVTGLAAAGCATQQSKALDTKVAEEPAVASRQELQAEASQRIESDTDLSADQKERLEMLRKKLNTEMTDLNAQSLKLRAVLVQDILSPGYSLDEVSLIKSRLKKLEDKRLSVMFDGVDEANSILGHQAARHPRMMRALLEERAIRN